MKLLRCKLCHGEMDIIGNPKAVFKKVKCRKCSYTNAVEKEKIEPEVIVIRKRQSEWFYLAMIANLNKDDIFIYYKT